MAMTARPALAYIFVQNGLLNAWYDRPHGPSPLDPFLLRYDKAHLHGAIVASFRTAS